MLRTPAEHLDSGQLAQRGFFQSATLEGIDTIYDASEKAKRIECNIEAK